MMLLTTALVASAVAAGGRASNEPEGSLAAGGGYVVPEPPALVALDRPGADFMEPSAPADFAVSADSFFNQQGQLRPGGGIEVGLRVLGLTDRMSAKDYLTRPLARLATRTYLSLATAADPDVTGDVLFAVGARTLLWKGADAYLDAAYIQAAEASIAECEALRGSDAPDWISQYTACVDKAYAERAEALVAPAWNAPGVVLSLANTYLFPQGSYGQGGARDVGGWLSASGPLGRSAQAGASVGWTHSLSSVPHQLGFSGLVRGGSSRARVAFEPGLVLAFDPRDAPQADGGPTVSVPLGLGGELLVDRDLWIQLSFGLVLTPETETITMLSQGTFRWGQQSQPSFMPTAAAGGAGAQGARR